MAGDLTGYIQWMKRCAIESSFDALGAESFYDRRSHVFFAEISQPFKAKLLIKYNIEPKSEQIISDHLLKLASDR